MKRVMLIMLSALALVSSGCAAQQDVSHAPRAAAYKQSPVLGESDGGVQAMAPEADYGGAFAGEGAESVDERARRERAGADSSQKNIERKLIRNAWLTIEVRDEDDYPEAIEDMSRIAEGLGGYVQSESSVGLTMLVPTEKLEDALSQLEKIGEITYRNITVVDATSNYVDLQIRIENLKKMRVRLTELVNQSTSVAEVLEVERELARVTAELERLEGQMRLLSKQTSYATINITLEERVRPGPVGWIFYGAFVAIKWLFVWD